LIYFSFTIFSLLLNNKNWWISIECFKNTPYHLLGRLTPCGVPVGGRAVREITQRCALQTCPQKATEVSNNFESYCSNICEDIVVNAKKKVSGGPPERRVSHRSIAFFGPAPKHPAAQSFESVCLFSSLSLSLV
jgi:hypothetical protein